MPSRFRKHILSISALIFFAILVTLIARSLTASAAPKEEMTPLLLSVQDAPIPFTGSDTVTHLAYELLLTNFSSGDVTLDGATTATLDVVGAHPTLSAPGMLLNLHE